MKWRLFGVVLLAIAGVAAWRTAVDMRDQTRVIIEAFIAIICGGVGIRLMFPRAE